LDPIQRDASQKSDIRSDPGIMEEFILGHEIKRKFEGEADKGNIRPVLMLRKNNGRSVQDRSLLHLGLDPIQNRENRLANPLGDGIDKRVPSHDQ